MKNIKGKTTNTASAVWYEKFSNLLIKKIEQAGQWEKGWADINWIGATPLSLKGGEYAYNCRNYLLLSYVIETEGYESNRFATFKAIDDLNFTTTKEGERVRKTDKDGKPYPFIHVLKGEAATPILFCKYMHFLKAGVTREEYDTAMKNTKTEGEALEVRRTLTFSKYFEKLYYVFNICQTNLREAHPELWEQLKGESDSNIKIMKGHIDTIDELEEIISNCGVPINYTRENSAYYSVRTDKITLPYKAQFKDAVSYYATALHEIAHSTGAEGRLHRDQSGGFGSKNYAKEELIAELSSACVLAQYGIPKKIDNTPAYLKSWLSALKEEPDFIKEVMQDVQKAVNYLFYETGVKQPNQIEISE